DKTVRILYVGRIVPEKGVHVLLDAMTLLSDALQKQDLSLELTLVGTPVIGKSVASSYYHSILERIEHLHEPRGKLRLQVRHIPYLNRVELTQRYLATDIVVCPSVWEEPWAYVKLEALFFKAVLIASKAGGIPEGLTSGKDCFLIEKGDAKALASRLESVLLGISKKDASLKALCERGHTLVASQYLTQNRYKRFLAGIQSVFAGKALARRTPRK
ncbi:MAG: glycosyltransferase, partial [Nanoarchaeota archaeon]|nr:glycosyltransferase [Nanoarchaeota archaeon]